MRKALVSSLLWIFFLALVLIGGWIIRDLQNALNWVQEKVHEVSLMLEESTIKLAETQRAHGSAQEEIEWLNDDILMLRKSVEEHDAMLESIWLMMSQ